MCQGDTATWARSTKIGLQSSMILIARLIALFEILFMHCKAKISFPPTEPELTNAHTCTQSSSTLDVTHNMKST